MKARITIPQIQQQVRAQVCETCPFRTPGTDALPHDQARPCEATCPIFEHLPAMAARALQADPLVGRPRRTLARILVRIGKSGPEGRRVIRNHGRKVLAILENLAPR